jgi:glycerol kinase
VTDITNASRTMLLNIHQGQWDQELLDLFDIPAAVLPEVSPSSHLFGTALYSAAPSPSPVLPVISKPRCSGRRVLHPAWQRIPMAPVVSC